MELSIEEVKALYFDSDALVEPAIRLWRIDGGDFRYYYDITNGEPIFYGSVTSVIGAELQIGKELIEWIAERGIEEAEAERDERADYGTIMHILIAYFLIGKISLQKASIIAFVCEHLHNNYKQWWIKSLQKDLLSFAQFVNEHNVKPLAIEVTLASRKLGIAGTIDLICKMEFNRKIVLAIVDFKSGKKGFHEAHEIQLHAYKQIWEENYPDMPIEYVFNWAPSDWRTKPAYHLKNQTESKKRFKLPHLIAMFKIDGYDKPKKRLFVNGDIQPGIDISKNFEFIDIEQYVRNKHAIATPGRIKQKTQFVDSVQIAEQSSQSAFDYVMNTAEKSKNGTAKKESKIIEDALDF